MSCQDFASPSDVLDLQIGPEGPTEAQVQQLLQRAWVKLRGSGRAPLIDARLAAGTLDREAVGVVLTEMVQAVLLNPTGLRSRSETTGPFGESQTFDVSAAAGRLMVTDEHLDLLGLSSGGAYTVTTPFVAAWSPAGFWC